MLYRVHIALALTRTRASLPARPPATLSKLGNLYMGAKQMGAIQIHNLASRLPSIIRLLVKLCQTICFYCPPFALPPFGYPLPEH